MKTKNADPGFFSEQRTIINHALLGSKLFDIFNTKGLYFHNLNDIKESFQQSKMCKIFMIS